MTSIACTALSALALAVLLYAIRTENHRLRMTAKPLASAGFILVAVLGGALDGGAYPRWIVVGLVLGAGGDVALMFAGRRAFLAGLVLFLLGHVAYVVACHRALPLDRWSGLAAMPALLSAAALIYLWPHVGSMKGPVIAYVLVITAMLGAALEVVAGVPGLSERAALLAAIGAALFYASDLLVARERFVVASFKNRLLGLPAYYAGQLLFAWSSLS